MAWASARRTRTSLNGGRALLIAMSVSPSVLPTDTPKRGSPRSSRHDSGDGRFGKASMSPARSAATEAAGSGMTRKVTARKRAGVPQ